MAEWCAALSQGAHRETTAKIFQGGRFCWRSWVAFATASTSITQYLESEEIRTSSRSEESASTDSVVDLDGERRRPGGDSAGNRDRGVSACRIRTVPCSSRHQSSKLRQLLWMMSRPPAVEYVYSHHGVRGTSDHHDSGANSLPNCNSVSRHGANRLRLRSCSPSTRSSTSLLRRRGTSTQIVQVVEIRASLLVESAPLPWFVTAPVFEAPPVVVEYVQAEFCGC